MRAAMKQFALSAAILALCLAGAAEAKIKTELEWHLIGAGSDGSTFTPGDSAPAAHFLGPGGAHAGSGTFLNAYGGVYPGIDVAYYGDRHHFEVVFILLPGADPSQIRMKLDGMSIGDMSSSGDLVYERPCLEVYQHAPVAFLEVWPMDGDSAKGFPWARGLGGQRGILEPVSRDKSEGRYDAWSENTVGVIAHDAYAEARERLNGARFNVVPAGGQPGGPEYDYFFSKFESTHEQVLRFLNDAQKNPDSPRGQFMYFDEKGNVWFNPEMRSGRDELFDVTRSKLVYDPDKNAGERYSHQKNDDGEDAFAYHPCGGISWYGAVKYCNWLTINAGRGPGQRCYTEGTNSLSWAPVTATNWVNGIFEDGERLRWLEFKGFRLPMVNSDLPTITTNKFNEFHKAGSWSGDTNRLFGFGRDMWHPQDANCPNAHGGLHIGGMRPVGFYDGQNRIEGIRTRREENLYGLCDITGNATEWMNDHGHAGNPATRAVCSICRGNGVLPVAEGLARPPFMTDGHGSFRPLTTFMPAERIIVHVLYCFHTRCAPGEEKEEEVGTAGREVDEEYTWLQFDDPDDDSPNGGIIGIQGREEEEEEVEEPPPTSPGGA